MNTRLDSDIEPEKQRLKDKYGSASEDMEILGYGVMYSVGADANLLVPREWLLDRVDELDIPQWIVPRKPTPNSAYKRVVKLLNSDWTDEYQVDAPRLNNTDIIVPHTVEVSVKEGDGININHIHASVFFPENECGVEGGKWVDHHLGRLGFDDEKDRIVISKDNDLAESDLLFGVWDDVANTAENMFYAMQDLHIASDIRGMMQKTIDQYTNTVIMLQRAVYLFPVGLSEFVDSMSQLYREIDEKYKEKGEPTRIRTFEIMNTEDKREWIQERVRDTLEENIDRVLQTAFDSLDEGETAEAVVRTIRENLGDDEETIEMYNALLETKLSIKKILQEKSVQLSDDQKSDIIESVLSQSDLSNY